MVNSWSEIVGWTGAFLTAISALPQYLSPKKPNQLTYKILCVGLLCLLIRAAAIREYIFVTSNVVGILIAALTWKRINESR